MSCCHLLESPHLVRASNPSDGWSWKCPLSGGMLYAGSTRTSTYLLGIASHNHGTPRMSYLWCGASTGYAAGSKSVRLADSRATLA